MNKNFREGYELFRQIAPVSVATEKADAYVDTVYNAITKLAEAINALPKVLPVDSLKGSVAEEWHTGTFNIKAALRMDDTRAVRLGETSYASVDIQVGDTSYSSKYYNIAEQSAKQQSKSHLEYAKEKHYDPEAHFQKHDISDPHGRMYGEQQALIPSDQLEAAREALAKKMQAVKFTRPDQYQRYKDTHDFLTDRMLSNDGSESIPLSESDAKKIAITLKNEDGFEASKWGISLEESMTWEYIADNALRAGGYALAFSVVLKMTPEIFKTLNLALKNRHIRMADLSSMVKLTASAGAEGFLRGTMAAAVTSACHAGKFGSSLVTAPPSAIAMITVMTFNVVKSLYLYEKGIISQEKCIENVSRAVFTTIVTGIMIKVGALAGIVDAGISTVLAMVLGATASNALYNALYSPIMHFCVLNHFALFGLVKQDYYLPKEILKEIGLSVFEEIKASYAGSKYNQCKPKQFNYKRFDYRAHNIKMLKRGIIGFNRIGYV